MSALTAYVLIVWIAGQQPRVTMEHDFWSCTARIGFEARYDPSINAVCVPYEGDEA